MSVFASIAASLEAENFTADQANMVLGTVCARYPNAGVGGISCTVKKPWAELGLTPKLGLQIVATVLGAIVTYYAVEAAYKYSKDYVVPSHIMQSLKDLLGEIRLELDQTDASFADELVGLHMKQSPNSDQRKSAHKPKNMAEEWKTLYDQHTVLKRTVANASWYEKVPLTQLYVEMRELRKKIEALHKSCTDSSSSLSEARQEQRTETEKRSQNASRAGEAGCRMEPRAPPAPFYLEYSETVSELV